MEQNLEVFEIKTPIHWRRKICHFFRRWHPHFFNFLEFWKIYYILCEKQPNHFSFTHYIVAFRAPILASPYTAVSSNSQCHFMFYKLPLINMNTLTLCKETIISISCYSHSCLNWSSISQIHIVHAFYLTTFVNLPFPKKKS